MNSIPYFITFNNLSLYFLNYIILFGLLFFFFLIVFFIIFLSFLFIKKNSYRDKLLPYECGFEPYKDVKNVFNIQFYLIALFFLLFDLESLYLYPIVFGFPDLTSFNIYILLDFFFELFLCYIYIFKYLNII